MQLSVIIVNYNVKYFLEECLQSVKNASKNISTEIIVVDNNSIDGSVEWIKQRFDGITIIANKKNVGFSKANNQAIKQAKGKYILLLNPDTVVQENTFTECINFIKTHPNAGAIGVKMVDGAGKYLPESKRGFPSPRVSILKMIGLSKIFPKSAYFNQYYLGNLSNQQSHEIEVLAGAFMFIKKEVLDKIGLLDETFFMYGEDIDLSWRIIKGGYKNYYIATTQIIHYKGESTKKATFNYVKHFYNAMVIFAQKHFAQKSFWWILLLQFAIFTRGIIAFISNSIQKIMLPFFDIALVYLSLIVIKIFWETNYMPMAFKYPPVLSKLILPIYTMCWIVSVFFAGGYDKPIKNQRVLRGLLLGTLFISSVYAFLPEYIRFSRAIILLGSISSLFILLLNRVLFRIVNPNFYKNEIPNILVVGSNAEANRVRSIINNLGIMHEWIGCVHPTQTEIKSTYIGNINTLPELVEIFKVNELIFCSKDISAEAIMHWMTNINKKVSYKIVGEQGMSIVGSNSRNTAGDLYAMDFNFSISSNFAKRNKLLFDVSIALILILTLPVWILLSKNRIVLLRNILPILILKKTWVGYENPHESLTLPKIKQPVFNISLLFKNAIDEPTKQHFKLLYAKNYTIAEDARLLSKFILA